MAAVRSGRPGPSSARRTGVPSAVGVRREVARRPRRRAAWRSAAASSTPGSASSRARAVRVARPPTSADRSRPPTPYAVVTPTPAWSSSASTCWQPVPEAATMPDRSGGDDVGEPEPEPADDRRCRSRAPSPAGRGRRRTRLSATLLLDRDVVAEDHHVAAGLEGVHGLDGGARHRAPTRARARPARAAAPTPWCGAAPPRRGRRPAGGVSVRARSTSARTASSASASVEPDRDDQVVDGRVGRDREPHPLQHLDVQRRRHRHLGRHHAGQLLHLPADLEQRHRVGVGAGAELDVVGAHAAVLMPRPARLSSARARSMPWARPRPGALPEGLQRRPRGVRARRTEGAEVGRDRVGDLAGEGALEEGGGERGRAREEPAYGVVDRGRGHSGGAVGGEPAARRRRRRAA